MVWHIIRANTSHRQNQDVSEYSYQKIEANCQIIYIFFVE